MFGFFQGDSPALVSTVSRSCAMMPSFELARQELSRHGIDLDSKTVRGISERLGEQILTTRTRDLMAWREGELPAGEELAGKRIAVEIDGGRTRLRENRRPQRRRNGRITRRRRYDAEWREPKLLTIFEIDKQGRMKKRSRAWIDGTFQGPDHVMELVALHLHRLGAAKAKCVVFLSDGAPWIWDRLDWVEQKVGLPSARTYRVLDWCHAVHHVSLALAALNLSDEARRRMYRRLRIDLRAGRVDLVLKELRDRSRDQPEDSAVWGEIRFLEKHAPHMAYQSARRRRLPIGSGAIESTIRRVVNLRLKGNGIMWVQENAEAILVLRAAAVTDRWEETLAHARNAMAQSSRLDWEWSAPDIPHELNRRPPPSKPPRHTQPPRAQTLENKQPIAMLT